MPLAAIYLPIAAITTYLSWPYLWNSLISHYLESVQTMSQFPFATRILFSGKLYMADGLPKAYFPTFLGIQLTEPALLLFGIGIVSSILLFYKKESKGPFILLLVWFLIPALVIIASSSPLYDNARQLYFLYPPLFIAAGIAIERIFTFLSQPLGKGIVLLLTALPGVVFSIRLHPYEYIYYNSLVGGTGGAYRKFEMDYWGISLKDLTADLNAVAASDARVLVFGPEQIVRQYARPDIAFIQADQPIVANDYVIFLTRENLDERRCKGADTIASVGRRGAIFSVLKSVPSGIECQ
jgi:hypothetical protein